MDRVTISVPSSSANVGLGYDIWCLGLDDPRLSVTCIRRGSGVKLEGARSPLTPPEGRTLGVAGVDAAERFLSDAGIAQGLSLLLEDEGYPVGGLGRSGAEAVGAVMGAAVMFEIKLSRDEVITTAAVAEPGRHRDNVSASVNGRFNIIASNPLTGRPAASTYDTPEDLGIAIGYSSHQKTGGTAAMRAVLEKPVPTEEFVAQAGLISAATAALVTGNTRQFLGLAWGDRFHEPRRADAGGYGPFTAAELGALKRRMYEDFGVSLNISGAGPNIQLLYHKADHPEGLGDGVSTTVATWFEARDIHVSVRATEVAREGAYDFAQRVYGY